MFLNSISTFAVISSLLTGLLSFGAEPPALTSSQAQFQKHIKEGKPALDLLLNSAQWANGGVNAPHYVGYADSIALVDFYPNIGDAIIFSYSMIEQIRQRYPGKPVHVFSPSAGILSKNVPNLIPHVIDHRIAKLGMEISPKALVIGNFGYSNKLIKESELVFRRVLLERKQPYFLFQTTAPERTRSDLGKTRMQFETNIHDAGSDFFRTLPQETQHFSRLHADTPEKLASPIRSIKIDHSDRLISQENLTFEFADGIDTRPVGKYEMSEQRFQVLFGDHAKLQWNPADFADSPTDQSRAGQYLAKEIGGDGKPFYLINLNTKGASKLPSLQSAYRALLTELVTTIQTSKPGTPVVVVEPEPHFGYEVAAKFSEVVKTLKEKNYPVKVLELSQAPFWKTVASKASKVISVDSGFVHVANVMNPGNVLGFSMSGKTQAHDWAKPGQPSLDVDGDVSRVTSWVREQLEGGDPCVVPFQKIGTSQ